MDPLVWLDLKALRNISSSKEGTGNSKYDAAIETGKISPSDILYQICIKG